MVLALQGAVVSEALLAPGRFVIGRTTDNDLQIDSKFVSRHHAQIVTTRDGSSIEDLNSTNGIFVRGRRIRRSKLAEGDVVKIGVHELIYHDAGAKTREGLTVAQLHRLIREAGRDPVERDTLYRQVIRDASDPVRWRIGGPVVPTAAA